MCLVLVATFLASVLAGTPAASGSGRSMPTAGRAIPAVLKLATSSGTNFSSPTPELLAQLNGSDSGFSAQPISSLSNTFTMDTGLLSNGGEGWDLGDGVWLTGPGITNFTAGTDPDQPHIAALLADGTDESLYLQEWTPFGGGGGSGAFESGWFNRHPDFVGNRIDFIRLNEHDLSLTPSGGGTQIAENHTWEIWGHRLFVAFFPPTDPDGAYLVDRNDTIVNVSLAEPGTASLNWDGFNRSMTGSGTNWSLAMNDLPNGVYVYEVYAQNATGAVFSTGLRRLTVGVGIWTRVPFRYGFQPSLAYDAQGRLHACFGGSNLTYAVLDAGSWNLTTVANLNGFAFCSLALDSAGLPEIAYSSSAGVVLAAFNGAAWSSSLVSPTPYTIPSLAIDSLTNRPRIAYADLPSVGLVLDSFDNGAWTTQVVASGYTGFNPSLAIDSLGQPHIAYYDPSSQGLRYAVRNGTGWSLATIDAPLNGATQGQISLRLDASDRPHIGYVAPTGLKYAHFNGTGWANETVDVKTFSSVSLSLDSLGRPELAYARWGGDARFAAWNGTSWSSQVVTHATGISGYDLIGMAVSPAGDAAMLYPGSTSFGNLVLATNQKDVAPPSTSASLRGVRSVSGWYSSPVEVTLVATDDMFVLNTSYRIDSGAWLPYAGPFTVSGVGNHAVEYFSIDAAGKTEPVETTSVRIDTSSPTVQAYVSGTLGNAGWYVSAVLVNLTANDTGSGIASVRYRVDGGPWQNYTAPFAIANDGRHLVTYVAFDSAGNPSTVGHLSPNIDATPPVSSSSVDGISGAPGWYVSDATVRLSTMDATSGVASSVYRVDAGGWRTYLGPFVLGDGVHTVEFHATDTAGNVEAAQSAVVRVDMDPPILSNVTPAGHLTSGTVGVSWSGQDTVSGIAGYSIAVDGGSARDVGMNTSATLSLPDGAHVIRIEAFDVAGHSANETTAVTIDTNVFSPSGPYQGIPSYFLAGLALGAVTFLLLRRWRRRKSHVDSQASQPLK